MKMPLYSFLAAVVLAVALIFTIHTPLTSPAHATPPIVLIDPGHGGPDPGAMSAHGVMEKHINLAIARRLGRILQSYGVRVIYTRTADAPALLQSPFQVAPDLYYRGRMAQKVQAQAFITIHTNAEASHHAKGPIVYFTAHDGPSQIFATVMTRSIQARFGESSPPRPIRQTVLLEAGVPAVNVEVGFVTNSYDAYRLTRISYQTQLAQAISQGIIKFLHMPVP